VNDQTLTTFFALVALLCMVATVLIAIGAVVMATGRAPGWLMGMRNDLGRAALRIAPLVAGGATLGSLYYSEVVGYQPCVLCWAQRIFMYSLALVLTVGAIRNDIGVRAYGLVLAIPGAAISIYHSWLQAYPRVTSFCTVDAPCAERHVWEFGFVSIPLMALAAFGFVIALLLVARPSPAGGATGVSSSDVDVEAHS
jgi:disulfide bond formation protein DsbB